MKNEKQMKKHGSESPSVALTPEADAFEKLVKQVLSVPKSELDRREAEYQERKGKATK